MNNAGRKSKYETHILPKFEEIKDWRQSGFSERTISEKLGINYSTFSKYKNEKKEFSDLLSDTKEKLVTNLKKSLWKEAMGFEYEETKTVIEESYLGTKKKIEKVKKKARSQPNLLIFALCNLCPEFFKRVDKEVVEELKDTIKEEMTDKRLKLVYKLMNPSLSDEQLEKETKKVKVVGDDE
jgi:transcriptional regulator with XRE-family HTH domain